MDPVQQALAALRTIGAGLTGRDLDVYAQVGLAADEPVVGLGPADAPVAFLGRDPGREELVHRTGFVGASGRKIRGALCPRLLGRPSAGMADLLEVGQRVFWVNTVPFKPIGNKAWPAPVRASCAPWIADLIVHGWRGTELITLGKEALAWFDLVPGAKIGERPGDEEELYRSSFSVTLPSQAPRALRVHPLPHPSPLNVRWTSRFPGLLEAALDRCGVGQRPPIG